MYVNVPDIFIMLRQTLRYNYSIMDDVLHNNDDTYLQTYNYETAYNVTGIQRNRLQFRIVFTIPIS